jgi:Zn-dependent protease with chaperone function
MSGIHFRAVVYGLEGDPKVAEQVTLDVRRDGLAVRSNSGKEGYLAFQNSEASLVGAEQGTWMFKSKSDALIVCVEQAAAKEELFRVVPQEFQSTLKHLKREQQKTGRRFFYLILAFLLAILLLILGVLYAFSRAVDWATDSFPVSWEVQLGDLAYSQSGNTNEVVDDPVLNQALAVISSRLLKAQPNSPYEFKFHVVRSKDVNAFALPGGNVMVNTGLIASASTPEEVAGVLAHEMQHVLRRHGVRGVIRSMGISASFGILLGFSADQATLISSMAPRLLDLTFDRAQEAEADRLGMQLLIKAGIDTAGMVSFFEKLSREEGSAGAALSFVSTHPSSASRVESLKEQARREGTSSVTPFLLDWTDIRDRASRRQ